MPLLRGDSVVDNDPIYLLVGKRERVKSRADFVANDTNETTLANWQDLNNLWVTVNVQTGQITTEPMASNGGAGTADNSILAARGLAAQRKEWEEDNMRGIRDWGLGIGRKRSSERLAGGLARRAPCRNERTESIVQRRKRRQRKQSFPSSFALSPLREVLSRFQSPIPNP